MAARQLPTSYTAGRPLRLEGVDYAVGDAVPNDVIARTKHVTALISKRLIVPATDTYGRVAKVPMRTGPFRFLGKERQQLAAGKIQTPPRSKTYSSEPFE